MFRPRSLFLCCLIAAAAPGLGADSLDESVTRMARIGRAGSPSFSPDGRHIAFVADLSGMPQIWVVPSEGGWPLMVSNGNDPVGQVTWSPKSDWLAFTVAPGGGMNTQVYVVRRDGTGLRRLSAGGKETNNLTGWSRDGSRLLVASNTRRGDAIDGYLLDPLTDDWQLVAKNEGVGGLSDVTRDGAYAIATRTRSRGDNNLYLIDTKRQTERLLTPHEGPGQFAGLFAPDGKTIYAASNKGRDLLAFARIRIAFDGAPGPIEVLAERTDAELADFELNDQGTVAALLWNKAGRSELAFVDLKSGRATPGPDLPGEIAGALTFSQDGRSLALTISGSTAPPDVWTYDMSSRRLRQITFSPHPGVNLSELVKPQLVSFKAHDDLELTGWLYRPHGRTGAMPFVVSFHGGPEGQERPSFRSDYQALVAQGIGVFAPNVRGSSGFGKKFVNLDNGELRFNGLRDIKSSVDYLVQSGNADAKRIGITGGSYGGYMTLAGLTEYPDLFAAGVDLFGMVNFFTFFEHTEPWMAAISTVEYGDPKTQADLLRRLSPLAKIDRIKAPTMVQHGANDTNVPVVEAEQVVSNLKTRNVPVEYVLFTDEGHGWRKVNNRIRSTVTMVQFFSRYLGTAKSGTEEK